jgi:thiopurine S-methyltransferase
LQPDFWLERWRTGQIGFHQAAVDRHLKEWWPQFKVAQASIVLVPLCGKSLDLLWLRDQGYSVVGIELSAAAIESFCVENGIAARRRTIGRLDVFEAENLTLYNGDLFDLSPALLGNIAAVYDRAALISWAMELRSAYAEKMTSFSSTGTQTLLIAVEYPSAQMAGPPFPVTSEDVSRLYGQTHSIELLARHNVIDLEPRLRARGLTELSEVCYRLTRL